MDKTLRHIPDINTFYNLFATFENVDEQFVDVYPKGAPLLSGALLIRADGEQPVYLIDQEFGRTVKRWISSPDVFNRYGFQWEKVVVMPRQTVSVYRTGAPIH